MAKTLTVFGVGGNGGRGRCSAALSWSGRAGGPVADGHHTFNLDQAAEAFQTASSKAGGAIKVLVEP